MDTIKEFNRLDAQYEIVELLKRELHCCDYQEEEQAHVVAVALSYKIMRILKNHEVNE